MKMKEVPAVKDHSAAWWWGLLSQVPIGVWLAVGGTLIFSHTAVWGWGASDSVHKWFAERTQQGSIAETQSLRSQNSELKSYVQRLEHQLQENEATAAKEATLNAEALEKVEAELDEEERLVKQLTEQHAEAAAQLNVANTEIEQLSAELESAKAAKPSDDVQVTLDQARERATSQAERASRAMAGLAQSKIENDRLRAQVAELNTKLQEVNGANLANKSSDGKPSPPKPSRQAQQIIDATEMMSSGQIAGFLKKSIPRVQGGITCWELYDMIADIYLSNKHLIVIDAVPYLQFPIDDGCITRLSKRMSASKVHEAIDALLSAQSKANEASTSTQNGRN
ncbi:hypothetical protein [Pelagibius sp.]|uniref:hypothetical protein n=1 Tax=Pelagibius sp. TaxID=1931238 RepID=UPI003BB06776